MLILGHPTGNANVRQAVEALNEVGLLAEFWTSIDWRAEHPVNCVLPASIRSELSRRSFPQVRADQVHLHPWPEIARLLAGRFGITRLVRHEVGRFCVDAVYRGVDRTVAERLYKVRAIQGVYAYEDGAVETFRAARQLGIKTFYELPIGYWKPYRELMEEEAMREPEWVSTLRGNMDSSEKLLRKEEELALTDHLIVPSEFVRRTLSKADSLGASINVVPYGAPATTSNSTVKRSMPGKLKVIFVGALTQRKGLSYLLRAVERLGSRVELTIVGKKVANCSVLDRALAAHRWIPSLPHPLVLEEISRHDVMVFPSLFEGFGLVILEAMAAGVPVVTTSNGGGPELVSDGEDGFIVPIRDVEAIAERLELLLHDPERLSAMSHAALLKTRQHTWSSYRQRLAGVVQQAVTRNARDSSLPYSDPACLRACNPC